MPRISAGYAMLNEETESYVRPEPRTTPKPAAIRRVEATRMEGSVRKLRQDRGFGFIAGDDGRDWFFHWSGMEKTSKNFRDLEIQDRVSFLCVEGDKGPRAICIRVIE